MSLLFPSSLTAFVAEHYAKLLRKHPVPTLIATGVVVSLVAALIYNDESRRRAEESSRRESLTTYSQQLQQLDGVQQGLRDLSDFVSQQRTRLQESEQLVSKLQEEKQRIEPLVQADRKVVDAVFQLQEQRAAAAISRERWIGFGLGVAASLLASFLYAVGVFMWRKTKKAGMTPKTHNKSPEPTAVGAGSSAVAIHVASRRWLSFFR
jgi:TolA-binding protein